MRPANLCAAIIAILVATAPARADQLVLFAGGGQGADNVPAVQAALLQPFGIDFDASGNAYLVELKGGRVLRIDGKGVLTVVGGTGSTGNDGDGGPARKASF